MMKHSWCNLERGSKNRNGDKMIKKELQLKEVANTNLKDIQDKTRPLKEKSRGHGHNTENIQILKKATDESNEKCISTEIYNLRSANFFSIMEKASHSEPQFISEAVSSLD